MRDPESGTPPTFPLAQAEVCHAGPGSYRYRSHMTRSFLLTVALALTCLGAGTGAFIAGRSNGPDLSIVARAGNQAGARSGFRAGVGSGQEVGYRLGYRAGYKSAYERAYRTAYLHAVAR